MTSGDIEFYHSNLVLYMAKGFVRKPWDDTSYRSKQRALNKAVSMIQDMLSKGLIKL